MLFITRVISSPVNNNSDAVILSDDVMLNDIWNTLGDSNVVLQFKVILLTSLTHF